MENHGSDVVIVGGGVIGLSLAYQLALQKASIAVLEKGQMGQEASAAGAGILAPQAEMDEISPLTELCIASRNIYADFVRELMLRTMVDVEFSESGLLYVAFTQEEQRELEKRYQWQSILGLPVERLSGQEAWELENSLSRLVLSALFFPEEAYVDNVRLIDALKVACTQLKVRLVTGCHAFSLANEGSKVMGVETNLGLWPAKNVIIAAGSWSSMIRTELSYTVPIKPARGQMMAVTTNARVLKHVIYSSQCYLVPRKDGRILLGSTVEWVGYNKSVTLEGLHQIVSGALAIVPEMKSFSLLNCWAGLRPYCEDGSPVLGATEIEGLYFATGHFRNGLLLAPITAKLIAELVNTGKTPKLLDPFSPARFKT